MRVSSGVILALGGVALIYLGYTGYWKSAWVGLQGKAGNQSTNPGTVVTANGKEQTQTGGEGGTITGQVGTSPDLLGEFPKGSYYPTATGQLMVGNEGMG